MASPVGFKEWAPVCSAMARGEQSLILRKGGIHEGQKGFRFLHDRFWLFPTAFHSEAGRLRPGTDLGDGGETASEVGEILRIEAFVELLWKRDLTTWAEVEALAPYHVWGDEVLRERFVYSEEERLWLAFVRVHRLAEPWELPWIKSYGGCRSWVDLPEEGAPSPDSDTKPVMNDEDHAALESKISDALANAAGQ